MNCTNKNYIEQYYEKIQNGEVNVGLYVERWYKQVLDNIKNGAYFYNQKSALSPIIFIQEHCHHHEGELAPSLIKLELWQKAFLSVVFGILDKEGNRQFREVFLVVGRKNGKTLLASSIADYIAFGESEHGKRIYFSAPKLEQANLCYDATYQTIKLDKMFYEASQKRRSDIYIERSNSTIKPLSFNAKKSDGLNISLCTADEISSWGGDAGLKFYEVIKSSFGARRQPLLLGITTSGYMNDGVYDELFKRSTAVIGGTSQEKRLAPFLYTIDDESKWDSIEELEKSNPNIDVSISRQYLIDEMAIAKGSLSKKYEFLTKYCNIKQNSSQAWLEVEDINKCFGDEITLEQFRNNYAICGIDLSRTTDLTCATCVIEKNGILNVFAKFYMPRNKMEELEARDNIPYHLYVAKGWLELSGDNFVDYEDCYNWINGLIREYEIYPLCVGYDRYSSQYLIKQLEQSGFKTDDVYQGYNLSGVIRELEGLIKDGRINIGQNDLMKIHLLDTAIKVESETDKLKIIKVSDHVHIDGVASLLDAICVRQKYWDEIGGQLLNE